MEVSGRPVGRRGRSCDGNKPGVWRDRKTAGVAGAQWAMGGADQDGGLGQRQTLRSPHAGSRMESGAGHDPERVSVESGQHVVSCPSPTPTPATCPFLRISRVSFC